MLNFLISFEDFVGVVMICQRTTIKLSRVFKFIFLSVCLLCVLLTLVWDYCAHWFVSLSLSLSYFQPQICFVMLSSPGIYCPHIFFFFNFFFHLFFLSILWSTCASFMFMFIICLGVFFFLPCFLANSHLLALPLPPPAAVGFNVLELHLNISLCEKERNKRGGQQLKIDSKLAWHFQLHLKSICY